MNKTHRKKHKPDTASPTGRALLDIITTEEYRFADCNRHNPFIGNNLIDSLENVTAGLELVRDIVGNNNNGKMLSDDSQHGLYLFVESLKSVVLVERERVTGMQ